MHCENRSPVQGVFESHCEQVLLCVQVSPTSVLPVCVLNAVVNDTVEFPSGSIMYLSI